MDYISDISTYQMVLDRAPFLVDDSTNVALVGRLIYEVMFELDGCFRIASDKGAIDPPDLTRIGVDANYSILQRSIVADLVAMYILVQRSITTASSGATGLYLKVAKAGTAEVQYDQFNVKEGIVLTMDAVSLIALYKKSAQRRARLLGCIIDICDDCITGIITEADLGLLPPFLISSPCNCGCS